MGGLFRTRSGADVDLWRPDDAPIALEDIAHALGHLCRFGGHVSAWYSVAEHSVAVAQNLLRLYADPRLALCGLLHDASEAYLGDLVRPLRGGALGREYGALAAVWQREIACRFGLLDRWDAAGDQEKLGGVDDGVLWHEARTLLPGSSTPWLAYRAAGASVAWVYAGHAPAAAAAQFLATWSRLTATVVEAATGEG